MDLRKSFFRYIIPSMLAFALSGVYAIADGFFVGNAMGDNALAAINIAYPLTAFLQAAGTGIGMGGAVPYSIYAGQKDPRRSSQYFGTSLLLLAASSLLLTLVFLAASPLVLTLFGLPGKFIRWAANICATSAWALYFRFWAPVWFPLSGTWEAP